MALFVYWCHWYALWFFYITKSWIISWKVFECTKIYYPFFSLVFVTTNSSNDFSMVSLLGRSIESSNK